VGDGDDERLKELKESKRILERELARLEEERNAEIVALSRDPSLMPEQALFQLITSIYNSIRRQYLKEVLITGGEPTARLIESYLADHLIPKKRELLDDMGLPERPEQTERLIDVEKRIAFLTDVLAQMETNT
jgi:DNA-binding transcriptional ArsR family regulator